MTYILSEPVERLSMDIEERGFRRSRTIGFWLAAVMSALQGLNAIRSFADPERFAVYMGIPIASAELTGWVQIYGLRAAFIAILTTILLIRQDFAGLKWMALAALVMPLGDAWLTYSAAAPAPVVGRHLAIAVFLLIVTYFLARAARQQASGEGSQ